MPARTAIQSRDARPCCVRPRVSISNSNSTQSESCTASTLPRYNQGQLKQGDRELYNAYLESMKLAKEKGLDTVAFSLLSAGIFRGPRSLEFVLEVGEAKFGRPFAPTSPDAHHDAHHDALANSTTHSPPHPAPYPMRSARRWASRLLLRE